MQGHKFQFPTLDDFLEAAHSLQSVIHWTPLLESVQQDGLRFKCENLQLTGSFKIRTAYNQIVQAQDPARRGIVTSSSGNFAQGVALAAALLGIDATIVMMERSNPLKVARTRELGARVVFCENRFEARNETVASIAERENRFILHPFDRQAAITGNGSIALEILKQFPDAESIVAPISGGGLIAGISLAAKLRRPQIRVIGVQPEGSNATFLSFQNSRRTSIPEAHTIADGLMVTIPGDLTFQVIQRCVDEVHVVSEESIREATRLFLDRERLVVEPSGAVTLAAVLEDKVPPKGTVLVLSGGNIDPKLAAELFSEDPIANH